MIQVSIEPPLDPVREDAQLDSRFLGKIVSKLLGKTRQFLADFLCLHKESKGTVDEEGPINRLGGSVCSEIHLVFGLAFTRVSHLVAKNGKQRRNQALLRSLLVTTAVFMPFLDLLDVLLKLLFHGVGGSRKKR